MKRIIILFITLMSIVGCAQEEEISKDEVVAVFNGESITGEEILLQYPLEMDYIETYLKEEIVVFEAMAMGIEVSQEKIEQEKDLNYSSYENMPNTDFYEEQAERLGVSPEEYFDLWAEAYLTRDAYFQQYFEDIFEEPSSPEEAELWAEQIENHMNDLMERYLNDEILVLIV